MAGQLHVQGRAHDIIISVISPGNGCDYDGQIIFYKARNDDIHPSEVSIMKLTLKYIMGSRQLCNQRRAHKLKTSGMSPGNVCDRRGS